MGNMKSPFILAGLLLAITFPGEGCRTAPVPAGQPNSWPRYTLREAEEWRLNAPGRIRFDASGLVFLPDKTLLTISDRGPELYRIQFPSNPEAPAGEAELIPWPGCFTDRPVSALTGDKSARLDCEGLARDDQGRIYVCEESNRWILRCHPRAGLAERLSIDWSPVESFFSTHDRNASFEGVAVGKRTLYVANERSDPRIIVVDLNTLKVVDNFVVYPQARSFFGTHYSDLAWHNNHLFILLRQHRVILELEPKTKTIIAEYDYRGLEDRLDYHKSLPVGIMEGLAVEDGFFWLVTDNNGWGRGQERDTRPTLLKCRRPDAREIKGPAAGRTSWSKSARW
jgi:Esterase-like activity of phytase